MDSEANKTWKEKFHAKLQNRQDMKTKILNLFEEQNNILRFIEESAAHCLKLYADTKKQIYIGYYAKKIQRYSELRTMFLHHNRQVEYEKALI